MTSVEETNVVCIEKGKLANHPRRHYTFQEISDFEKINLTGYRGFVDTVGSVLEINCDGVTAVKLADEKGASLTFKILGNLDVSIYSKQKLTFLTF